MNFIRTKIKTLLKTASVLKFALNWQVIINIDRKRKFSVEIIQTQLCPEMIIYSEKTMQVVMLELTVPCGRTNKDHEKKVEKYLHIVMECKSRG